MYSKILNKIIFLAAIILLSAIVANAQNKGPYFKDALKEKRSFFYNSIVKNINKTFALPLNDNTEDAWINAINNINLVKFQSTFINGKIDEAVKNISARSVLFKKALLELINAEYPNKYTAQIKIIFKNTTDDVKLLAMAANYILPATTSTERKLMLQQTSALLVKDAENAILYEVSEQIKNYDKKNIIPSLKTFFNKNYLPGQVLVISIQRKNRNYPGLALVRNSDGNFIKDTDGNFFSVGQLARSSSNMPGYITNGNTPQGIFRMDGFDTSKSFFIGPSTNVQLTMPFEFKATHFYKDNSLVDTVWNIKNYKNLLPDNFKNYKPIYGSFYAGKAGRTEIIAHGTTLDTAFYSSKIYAPYTPTAGCLCTKEIWNNKTGFLQASDQLLLTQAIKNAGGANGYLIVIEIDDKKSPVTIADIISFLK